jgi:uncharacterized protein with HEPN domain
MSLSDKKQIQNILKHIERIETFMKERTKRDLVEDLQLEQAVSLSLAMIGEAAAKLSITYKEKFPDIQWKKIKGFRNRIIHDYDGLDFDIVYQTIKIFLPELKGQLEEEKIILINKKSINKGKRPRNL